MDPPGPEWAPNNRTVFLGLRTKSPPGHFSWEPNSPQDISPRMPNAPRTFLLGAQFSQDISPRSPVLLGEMSPHRQERTVRPLDKRQDFSYLLQTRLSLLRTVSVIISSTFHTSNFYSLERRRFQSDTVKRNVFPTASSTARGT